MADVKEMIYNINNTFEEFKTKQTELEEKMAKGEAVGELKSQVEKMQNAMDAIEVKMQRPNFTPSSTGTQMTELEQKQMNAFTNFLRTGVEEKELQDMKMEYKAMSGGVPADGGNLIPQILANRIIDKVKEISPIRMLAGVQTIGIGNQLDLPRKTRAAAGGWIGETAARPVTDSPQFDLVKIPVMEMYANSAVTSNLLEDQAFNLESYIANDISTTFAQLEGAAFVSGDGTNKATGILNGAGIAGNLDVIKSGIADSFGFDNIYDLIYNLSEKYASNASFLAKRLTIRFIRTLKDKQDNYLWQPSNIVGQPATLAGYRIYETEDMPAIAADALPLAFGDWRQAYTIVDKRGMTMLRDPYSNKPFVNFYATMRVGGKISNPEAAKVLQCKA